MRVTLMLLILILFVLTISVGLPALLLASPMPQMRSLEPTSARAGDVVTVTGANLGAASVALLYLTDGTHDTEVSVVNQTATSIAFKVPAGLKPGRLALMVLTTGDNPRLIEQPVKLTIE